MVLHKLPQIYKKYFIRITKLYISIVLFNIANVYKIFSLWTYPLLTFSLLNSETDL